MQLNRDDEREEFERYISTPKRLYLFVLKNIHSLYGHTRHQRKRFVTFWLLLIFGALSHFSFTLQPLLQHQIQLDFMDQALIYGGIVLLNIGIAARSPMLLLLVMPVIWVGALFLLPKEVIFSWGHTLWFMNVLGIYLYVSLRAIPTSMVMSCQSPYGVKLVELVDDGLNTHTSWWRAEPILYHRRALIYLYWIVALPAVYAWYDIGDRPKTSSKILKSDADLTFNMMANQLDPQIVTTFIYILSLLSFSVAYLKSEQEIVTQKTSSLGFAYFIFYISLSLTLFDLIFASLS